MSDETPLSCSRCGAVWQKQGTTHCWSGDPATRPPKPRPVVPSSPVRVYILVSLTIGPHDVVGCGPRQERGRR